MYSGNKLNGHSNVAEYKPWQTSLMVKKINLILKLKLFLLKRSENFDKRTILINVLIYRLTYL